MKYTRIKMYYKGHYIMEHLYKGDSHVKAFERFYKDFPKYHGNPDCNGVAETIDSEDPEYKDYFKICKRIKWVD